MGLKISQLPDKPAEDGMMVPASFGGMTYKLPVGIPGGIAKYEHTHNMSDVLGLVDAIGAMNSINLFVSASGDDNNDGFDSTSPKRTIQAAVNSVPKGLRYFDAVIRVMPGVYDENVSVRDYYGSGAFTIMGVGTTPQDVSVKTIILQNMVNTRVDVANLTIHGTANSAAADTYSFMASQCSAVVFINEIRILSPFPNATRYGALTVRACGPSYFYNSEISNQQIAVTVIAGILNIISLSGTGNQVGLEVGSGWGAGGGIICVGLSDIQAATAERKQFGGQIFR